MTNIADLALQIAKHPTVRVPASEIANTCNQYARQGYVMEKMEVQPNGEVVIVFRSLI